MFVSLSILGASMRLTSVAISSLGTACDAAMSSLQPMTK